MATTSEIRRFKIVGEIRKSQARIPFRTEYRALKPEHALQRLYAEMGSKHAAKRRDIKVISVEEVPVES